VDEGVVVVVEESAIEMLDVVVSSVVVEVMVGIEWVVSPDSVKRVVVVVLSVNGARVKTTVDSVV